MEFSFSHPTLVLSGREDWKRGRERRQGTNNEWRAVGTSRQLRAGLHGTQDGEEARTQGGGKQSQAPR